MYKGGATVVWVAHRRQILCFQDLFFIFLPGGGSHGVRSGFKGRQADGPSSF
jgi:hypothetical protein